MENKEKLKFQEIHVSTDVAKISIVGSGMVNNAGVAADMFEALAQAQINIHMISTSEIKISVLIDKVNSEKALRAIHDKFFDI
jgi:aspartate kinase